MGDESLNEFNLISIGTIYDPRPWSSTGDEPEELERELICQRAWTALGETPTFSTTWPVTQSISSSSSTPSPSTSTSAPVPKAKGKGKSPTPPAVEVEGKRPKRQASDVHEKESRKLISQLDTRLESIEVKHEQLAKKCKPLFTAASSPSRAPAAVSKSSFDALEKLVLTVSKRADDNKKDLVSQQLPNRLRDRLQLLDLHYEDTERDRRETKIACADLSSKLQLLLDLPGKLVTLTAEKSQLKTDVDSLMNKNKELTTALLTVQEQTKKLTKQVKKMRRVIEGLRNGKKRALLSDSSDDDL